MGPAEGSGAVAGRAPPPGRGRGGVPFRAVRAPPGVGAGDGGVGAGGQREDGAAAVVDRQAGLGESVAWVPVGPGERDPQRFWLSERSKAPASAGEGGGASPTLMKPSAAVLADPAPPAPPGPRPARNSATSACSSSTCATCARSCAMCASRSPRTPAGRHHRTGWASPRRSRCGRRPAASRAGLRASRARPWN